MLTPNAQCNSIIRWGFWKWLGHEGGALLNRIKVLIKEISTYSLAPSIMWRHSEKSETQKTALIQPCWNPDLRLSASRTVRNKFLLLISHLSVVFCYSSPNRLRKEQQKEWKKKKKIKHSKPIGHHQANKHTHYVSWEGEETEKGAESLFKGIIDENFPALTRDIIIQIQKAQRTPSKSNLKKITLIQYNQTVKNQRQRENFESSKRKRLVLNKGTPMKLLAYFSAEILQIRREWYDIFKVLKEKIPDNQEYYMQQSCPSKIKE